MGWRESVDHVGGLLQPAVPFLTHVVASATTFTATLGVTQVLGKACRVSSATPILAPTMGFVGVGIASVAAGQAGLITQNWLASSQQRQSAGRLPPMRPWRREDMVLDAVLGLVLFKMMGGRFRNMMPSDLFKAGACARDSLPARSSNYASEVNRGELKQLMHRDGCHHCGRRDYEVVCDHIPPNKLVYGSKVEQFLTSESMKKPLSGVMKLLDIKPPHRQPPKGLAKGRKPPWPVTWMKSKVRKALGLETFGAKQRYFPQCRSCSQKQAAAVRSGRRTLVFHFGGPRAYYFSGILVGLRHYCAPAAGTALAWGNLSTKGQCNCPPGSSGVHRSHAEYAPWRSVGASSEHLKNIGDTVVGMLKPYHRSLRDDWQVIQERWPKPPQQ